MSTRSSRIKTIWIELSLVAYILIVLTSTRLIDFPDLIIGFINAPLIFIIPLLVGTSLTHIFGKKLTILTSDFICNYIVSFAAGICFMSFLLLLMDLFTIFNIKIYSLILILIILSRFLCTTNNEYKCNICAKNILPIVCFSIVPAILITHYSPYPMINSSDIFNHLHFSLRLLELNQVTYMKPYLPTFHILIATALYISNSFESPFSIFWAIRFLTYPLYAIGTYLFTYDILKKQSISFLSAFIAIWILIIFGGDNGLYNFTPRSLLYIMFPYGLYIINNQFKRCTLEADGINLSFFISIFCFSLISFFGILINRIVHPYEFILLVIIMFVFFIIIWKTNLNCEVRRKTVYLSLVFLSLLMIHNVMAIVLINILIVYIYLIHLDSNKIKMVFNAIPIFAMLLFLVQAKEVLILPTIFDFGKTLLNHGFSFKYDYLIRLYPLGVLTLFTSLGLIKNIKNNKVYPLIITTSLIWLLFSLPIEDISRVILFTPPLMAFFSADAIYRINVKKILKNKNMYFISVALCLVLLSMSLYSSQMNAINRHASLGKTDNYYTQFMDYEYETGQWIRNHSTEDTLLFSDRNTQFIIGGLSNRDVVFSRGGDNKFNEMEILATVLTTSNSTQAYNIVKSIANYGNFTSYDYVYKPEKILQHSRTLIIINGRTTSFLDAYSKNGLRAARTATGMPGTFHNFTGFEKFHDDAYFTLVYSIPDKIYVFEINSGE